MRALNVTLVVLVAMVLGCTPQLRAGVVASVARHEKLKAPVLLRVELARVRDWLETLEVTGLMCVKLDVLTTPCLREGATFTSSRLTFCLARGNRVDCFVAEATTEGSTVTAVSGANTDWELEQMLARFDPDALATLDTEVQDAVAESLEKDTREVGAWSLSAQVGVLAGIPNGPAPSFMTRLGMRRWVSPYLILGFAPGYERSFFGGTPRDSGSLTARLEFSFFDEDPAKMARRLNLPLLSSYVGLSTSLGFGAGQVVPSQRVFGGLQLLFLFIELGVAVAQSPSFYVSAGLGL